MPLLFTSRARLNDWKAFQDLHERVLLARAQSCDARRYALYRNVNDAKQLLLVAEFAGEDHLREFLGAWLPASESLFHGDPHEAVWEPLGWAAIP